MPYTHDEEKAEEQKRAAKRNRKILIGELIVILVLAGLIVAFALSMLTR